MEQDRRSGGGSGTKHRAPLLQPLARAPLRLAHHGSETIVVFVLVTAILYFGREVIMPLAFAVLIAFALSPMLNYLRRLGMPRVPAVMSVVTASFLLIGLFVLVVGHEVTLFAEELPTFQYNISQKISKLREAGDSSSLVRKVTAMANTVNNAVAQEAPTALGAAAGSETGTAPKAPPVPVQIVAQSSPISALVNLLEALIAPLASSALVLVVVVFVLLERDHVRDRFVRLIGTTDMHRTTLLLEEAAHRVGRFLLIQLLVNTIYAIPIAVGLWLLGIPNAVLWGMVSLVFRFIPYLGPIMSAAIPVLLAIAVTPGWTIVLWTLLLFVVVEVITANLIEPLLYGTRTGLSPLSIIVAAVFWTWIWGPLGLMLATPMTVCLVVIGRHIPQFELFNILLGDEPVLPRYLRLYQRLLVGDSVEAAGSSLEETETDYLADYHAEVTLPALVLAHADRTRGVLTIEQEARLCDGIEAMVDQLDMVVRAELEEAAAAREAAGDPEGALAEDDGEDDPLPLAGMRLIVVGGRSRLDDVSARVLFQAAQARGATGSVVGRHDFLRRDDPLPDAQSVDCVAVAFMGGRASRTSALYLRRLKRLLPAVRVGAVLWTDAQQPQDDVQSLARVLRELGADFVVHDIPEFVEAMAEGGTARPLAPSAMRRRKDPPAAAAPLDEDAVI